MAKIVRSGNSRAFLIPNGACPENEPEYHSCVAVGSVTRPTSSVENIEQQSRMRYGQWDHLDSVRAGTTSPCTAELTGIYARNLESDLLRIARNQRKYRRGVDLQIHIGECGSANQFYPFDKAIIMENARVSSWGINAGERDVLVMETVDIQSANLYEVIRLAIGTDATTDDETFVDIIAVPDCCGDYNIYALDTHHVWYYSDGWATSEIDTLDATLEDATCFAARGDWIIVFSEDSESMHYTSISDMLAGTNTWIESTEGLDSAPTCCCISPGMVWVGSVDGRVYVVENPTVGAYTVNTGDAVPNTINAINAMDERQSVAVCDGGVVIATNNKTTWRECTSPADSILVDFTTVWMIDGFIWFVGDEFGRLWHTLDAGETWSLNKDFS